MPGPLKRSPAARAGTLYENLLFRWQQGVLVANPKGWVKVDRNLLTTGTQGSETAPPGLPPPGGGGGTLSFAETAAGARLAGLYAQAEERQRGRERLTLEGTMFQLAKELLPPKDVGTAIQSLQRGELVKSKLAFQTAIQALQDRQDIELKRAELRQQADIEQATLKQARSKLVVDMMGRDLGRSVLFALGTGEGGKA